MRTILSLLLTVSVLTGVAAQARAADPDDETLDQQQDWKRNFGL
jgi:hypothetical protein